MAENPFHYNRPVEPAAFIGRWTLVDEIVADLSKAKAESGAVIGGRRFGKSSVLQAIASRLEGRLSSTVRGDRHILPLIVDIKGCERKKKENIYACIVQGLYERLQPYGTIAPSSQALQAIINGESDTLSFFQFKRFLNQVATQFDDQYGPWRVALLLDEVEATTDFEWCEDLFNQLRSLIYSGRLADTISLVLTGSSRVTQVRERGSPLLNMLTLRHLEPFSTAEIKQLMARGGEMPDEAAAAVQATSGGHPFIAQYLLHHIWKPNHGLKHATPEQVERIAYQMRGKRYSNLQRWWKAIGENGKKAYALLVKHESWVDEAAIIREIGDVTQGLNALCYHGLAQRDSSWRQYRYVGTLFREWVLQSGKGGSSTAFPGREANPEQRHMPYIAADERLLACARAVGQVNVPKIVDDKPDGTSTGTGWLVAPDLLLTCWHVIEARSNKRYPWDSPISEADLQKQIAQTQVIFDYKLPSQGTEYSVAKLEHHDTTLDVALLRLKNRSDWPLYNRSFLNIEVDPQLTQQSQLLIIQHPKEDPQKRANGVYKKPSPTLRQAQGTAPNRILYDTPTERGTSGAPVLNMTNWQVVALHNGEHKPSRLREGTLLSAIIASLKQKKPTLYQEIMNAQKTKE